MFITCMGYFRLTAGAYRQLFRFKEGHLLVANMSPGAVKLDGRRQREE
jgi:hypothetical protein